MSLLPADECGFLAGITRATTAYEHHGTRSGQERSKLTSTFFLEVVSGSIAIYAFTKFTSTLSEGTLDQVVQILLFESILAPLALKLQPLTYFKRRFVAPKLSHQLEQEDYFKGISVSPGEKLGKITAALFLGIFYVAVLPSGFFFTLIAFFRQYWSAKHGLFRRWNRVSDFDTSLLPVACGQTFLAILFGGLMSARFYAGWPFDDVCSLGSDPKNALYLCDKKARSWFMIETHDWMSHDQRELVLVFNFACLIFSVALGGWWLVTGGKHSFLALCAGSYKPVSGSCQRFSRILTWLFVVVQVGKDQGQPYTRVNEIQAYIPFVEAPLLQMPLIVADREYFNDEYLQCQCNYDAQDVFREVKDQMVSRGADTSPARMSELFSQCKFYPTKANPDPKRKIDQGDTGHGRLWVTISRATDLTSCDILTGKSDPMVQMNCGNCQWHTNVVCSSLNPVWNEEFVVQIVDLSDPLTFEIWDVDCKVQTDRMGRVDVDLNELLGTDMLKQKECNGEYEIQSTAEEEALWKTHFKKKSKAFAAALSMVEGESPNSGQRAGSLKQSLGTLFVSYVWKPNPSQVAFKTAMHTQELADAKPLWKSWRKRHAQWKWRTRWPWPS